MAVTQPRRVAALSLATRVAEEKNWRIGKQVGYIIRFEVRVTIRRRFFPLTFVYKSLSKLGYSSFFNLWQLFGYKPKVLHLKRNKRKLLCSGNLSEVFVEI